MSASIRIITDGSHKVNKLAQKKLFAKGYTWWERDNPAGSTDFRFINTQAYKVWIDKPSIASSGTNPVRALDEAIIPVELIDLLIPEVTNHEHAP